MYSQPPHPGELVKVCLYQADSTRTRAARDMKVSFSVVDRLVRCKIRVSPMMARRLARYFGTTAKTWLTYQRNYDLWKNSKAGDTHA
jgi:addiction module HigA family antidote